MIDVNSKNCENQMKTSVACYFGVLLYTFSVFILISQFQNLPYASFASSSYTHYPIIRYLNVTPGEKNQNIPIFRCVWFQRSC